MMSKRRFAAAKKDTRKKEKRSGEKKLSSEKYRRKQKSATIRKERERRRGKWKRMTPNTTRARIRKAGEQHGDNTAQHIDRSCTYLSYVKVL